MISVWNACAKRMLNLVFPIPVGPTMVIRVFDFMAVKVTNLTHCLVVFKLREIPISRKYFDLIFVK